MNKLQVARDSQTMKGGGPITGDTEIEINGEN